MAASLLVPLLLLVRTRWSLIVIQFSAYLGAVIWVHLMIPPDLQAVALPPDQNKAHIGRLPLVELPAADTDNDILAIILSGDGGWADLDRDFGDAFQKMGISTIGFDCLKYFWKPRKPSEVSRDLGEVVRYYMKAWNKQDVLLVGYSFGAAWLPFLVNRLPSDIQAHVRLVALLAPGDYANVDIHVGDWIRDERRAGALNVAPEASIIRCPVLCVYGEEEESESICPGLKGAGVHILRMPSGHHFGGYYTTIENTILNFVKPVTPGPDPVKNIIR
ncbi:MAG: AcvB/VirJ family lysyl-phosphatidylglycerol hydrolase [bacterium]